jgi:hypothetical protein
MSIHEPQPAPAPVVPPPARKGRVRANFQVLAVVAITLIFTVGLLEGALRLFAPQITQPVTRDMFDIDRGARFRNKPGASVVHDSGELHATYTINSQGVRGTQVYGPPPPDRTRLLCIGDSFTFGWGVEAGQAFPALLNAGKSAAGLPIESINAGVIGYGTSHEVAWMHEYGWGLQPKIVVAGFFVGNDVTDVMRDMIYNKTNTPEQQAVVDMVWRLKGQGSQQSDVETWLKGNSHAYVFLNKIYSRLMPAPPKQQPDMTNAAYNYLKQEPPERATGWKTTLSLLNELHWKAEQYGATFVVVAIPAKEQVDTTAWQDMQKPFGLTAADLDRELPQQRLAAWSAQSGVPVIDLLPGFRAAANPHLYFNADPHWTPAGHALAAQLIADGMVKLGLFSR